MASRDGAPSGGGELLRFSIHDVAGRGAVTPLPPAVAARWAAFSRSPGGAAKEARAAALRGGACRTYAEAWEQGRVRSPARGSRIRVADLRGRVAAAAAIAAAGQDDGERSAALAARMLANMQAAEERRLQARAAQRARLVAKSELIMGRLAQAHAKDRARRQGLLNHLVGRLARAEEVRAGQARGGGGSPPPKKARGSSCSGQLRRIVAVRGMEDWMQGLSPKTAESAAVLRATTSTRRVQRTWRRFARQCKTTSALARAFAALGVASLPAAGAPPAAAPAPAAAQPAREASSGGGAPPGVVMVGGLSSAEASARKHERFEDFAAKLQAPATLRAAQALLRRLEQRLALRGVTDDGAQTLLRQLSPSAPPGRQLERYPVRVLLCAFMIQEHPEVVFNTVVRLRGAVALAVRRAPASARARAARALPPTRRRRRRQGDVEARLSAAAEQLVGAFEALLARLVAPAAAALAAAAAPAPAPAPGSPRSPSAGGGAAAAPAACPSPLSKSMVALLASQGGAAAPSPAAARGAGGPSLASLLVAFDDSWLEYLDQFVVWKGHDAAGLATELMRMAVRLERSMRVKLGRRELGSDEVLANPDLRAMVAHVAHDHALLAERIARLAGAEGSARLAAALEHVRQQVSAELTAAEEAEAAAAAEAGGEAAGADGDARSRPAVSRSLSRGASVHDPVSDAEALAAAQAAAAPGGSAPAPGDDDGAAGGGDALSNEAMVWEMLYNPSFSLPTAEAEAAWRRAMGRDDGEPEALDASELEALSPDELTALVAGRARVIAERAFWDSIVWRFKTAVVGHALPGQLAPLLAELGTELSGFVRDGLEAAQLAEMYAEPAVLSRLSARTGLQGGGANLTALGAMMEQLAAALLKDGPPERGAEAAAAAAALHARIAAALAAAAVAAPSRHSSSGAAEPPAGGQPDVAAALAEALAGGLRLLMTQLKVVKLDAANARLAGLARAMRERGAVGYLQTKLASAWQLPGPEAPGAAGAAELAARLPRTAAWLAAARADAAPALRAGMEAAGLLLDAQAASAAVVAGGLQTVELRSGVRASPGASPSPRSPGAGAGGAGGGGAVRPSFPVSPDSWQGAVRAGLLALVASDAPAAGPGLPEVLAFDRARLHEAQNALQQLLVTAAGLLIVQQLRAAAGLPWDGELRAAARRRLMVVAADPGTKLAHIVAELTHLAGAGGVATEQRVKGMFTAIVNPEAAGFKAIRTALSAALGAHLMYGRAALAADGAAAAAAGAALSRVGAAALADDLAQLGERLAGVAAVSEAVCGDVLATLAGVGSA
ncbi:hypothetical protein HT031_000515 [Scenedesmus sp. PABB004]|nr:hypothetical protein HT031_000515 [Scenedesmus sp. PABB004]